MPVGWAGGITAPAPARWKKRFQEEEIGTICLVRLVDEFAFLYGREVLITWKVGIEHTVSISSRSSRVVR